MKTCPHCGETKPTSEFSRHAKMRDGLQTRCKICSAEQMRAWRQCNSHKVKQYQHSLSPDYAREYYAKNREKLLAYYRDRYRKRPPGRRKPEDPVKKALRWQRYYGENKEKLTVRSAKYRREREKLEESFSHADWDYVAILRGDPCAYCGAPTEQIDHIEPLSSGGSGGWENLTASCRRCNASKNAATLIAFLTRIRARQG